MNNQDFAFIAQFLKDKSGLIITQDKIYLIESRLTSIVREHGFEDVDKVIAKVRENPASDLARAVVYAMTTNETSFFRDAHPFETLRKTVIPRLMERRGTRKVLKIWSAASSTGQEPYSLAMMLKEGLPELKDWYVNIVATDLTPAVLERAKEGTYSNFEVQRGLPIQYLVKYFEPDGDRWRIKADVRRMVEFRQLDLLGDLTWLGTFDIVLCRNVLIYFDLPTKSGVLRAMCKRVAPDGIVILGGSESVYGICELLTDIPGLRGIYCHKADQGGWQQVRGEPPALQRLAS